MCALAETRCFELCSFPKCITYISQVYSPSVNVRKPWKYLHFAADVHEVLLCDSPINFRLGSERAPPCACAPNRQSAITWTCKFNFALKALFLSLDRNDTMLECNAISTLFAQYICLHGYIHFIYLFKFKYKIPRYVPYTANHPKNTEI